MKPNYVSSPKDFINRLTKALTAHKYEKFNFTEDIKLLTPDSIDRIAESMAETFRRRKTPIKTFNVKPVNDIEDWVKRLGGFKSLKKDFSYEPLHGTKEVKLIRCDAAKHWTEIDREISERGFLNAPFPYFFGLYLQYPDACHDNFCTMTCHGIKGYYNEEKFRKDSRGYLSLDSEYIGNIEHWYAVMEKQ